MKLRDRKCQVVPLACWLEDSDIYEEEARTVSPELISEIYEAIRNLPKSTGQVVTTVLVDGKKYKEAAEILGISVNTVKTLLAKGLKDLREKFSGVNLLAFFFAKNINFYSPFF